MEVDIYDFDKTVLPFDSSMRYWGYCMLHNPWILPLVPFQVFWGCLMGVCIISVDTCKRICFWYTMVINNKRNVKKFWDKYESKIYDWFKPENRPRTSVLISAGPDFLIDEIAKRLSVDYVICSKHTPKSKTLVGKVCRKQEKAKRFLEAFSDAKVKDVYSDSLSADMPILQLGERAFIVKNGNREQITL